MTVIQPVPPSVRSRLALALDVDDAVVAARLARQLRPWFGVAKVGLELFSAVGPRMVQSLIDDGYDVFADLKMADIPTTVNRAARVMGALGVSYLTLHAFVGPDVLRAGVEGLMEGAEKAGLEPPSALAVTVLTSDTGAPPQFWPAGWRWRSRLAVPAWSARPRMSARSRNWPPHDGGCGRGASGRHPEARSIARRPPLPKPSPQVPTCSSWAEP